MERLGAGIFPYSQRTKLKWCCWGMVGKPGRVMARSRSSTWGAACLEMHSLAIPSALPTLVVAGSLHPYTAVESKLCNYPLYGLDISADSNTISGPIVGTCLAPMQLH